MFSICNERNIHMIGLDVHISNMLARALYVKRGFQEVEINGEYLYMQRRV